MEFKKLSRDVSLISGEWRLASVDEVKSNFAKIKSNFLEQWSILRLLDGWVAGSGYKYELSQDYKKWGSNEIGEMLVVKTNTSRTPGVLFDPKIYDGVKLSDEGRKAAWYLSLDDNMTEVVYFVAYLFIEDLEKQT